MSLKVLIVDDDEIVIMIHRMMTIKSGLSADPICFSNGADAVAYLQSNFTEKDNYLVLLDLNMPLMNGWEFLDSIGPFPGLEIVIVTSSIDNRDHEKAKTYKQVIDFIEKPLNLETCAKIKNLLF
jgi:CheY-like chemotaxis protein